MEYIFKLLAALANIFPEIEMFEHCGNFFKLRVPKMDKTIGYLFGLIQNHKVEMKIQEYGIAQTSLEQIFATFALQDVTDKAAFVFKASPMG